MDILDHLPGITSDKSMDTDKPYFISDTVQKGEYFFSNLNPNHGDSLTITCGGLEHCGTSYKVSRQHFPYYGLEYVSSGSCEVKIGDQTIFAHSGHLFVYPPNTPLIITNSGQGVLTKYFVDFVGTSTDELLQKLVGVHHGIVNLSHSDWITRNFDQLLESGKQQNHQQTRLLLQLIFSQIPHEKPESGENHLSSYTLFRNCMSIIDQNYSTLHTLTDLAKRCNISEAYLCRVFQRFHRESPTKTLTRRKMEAAANQLIKRNLLVKQVAELCGYDDPYHFSRLFKSFFGVSPKHFTQQSRTHPS